MTRKLAPHRDQPVICEVCGRTVPRKARQQRFCSPRCRERGRDRTRKAFLRADTGAPKEPPKLSSDSNILRASKSWSSAGIKASRAVIEREIAAGRTWHEEVSPDGIKLMVTTIRRPALREQAEAETRRTLSPLISRAADD